MKIRLAHLNETGALEALQRRASLRNEGDREMLLANPDAIELPQDQVDAGQVFVAEDGGAVLGFGSVLPRADGDLELDALFVEPDTWQRGVGRALVTYAAQRGLESGARQLHVIGNIHAEGFYLACGFKEVARQQTRFGEGIIMTRRLA